MEASNVQKDVKPHIVLIDGVKYYSDKPETCRSCFFWKNRKVPCILGQENCYYLAEIIQSERRMAKSAKKNLSGDKPGSCSRSLYYRPDFKAIPHN